MKIKYKSTSYGDTHTISYTVFYKITIFIMLFFFSLVVSEIVSRALALTSFFIPLSVTFAFALLILGIVKPTLVGYILKINKSQNIVFVYKKTPLSFDVIDYIYIEKEKDVNVDRRAKVKYYFILKNAKKVSIEKSFAFNNELYEILTNLSNSIPFKLIVNQE